MVTGYRAIWESRLDRLAAEARSAGEEENQVKGEKTMTTTAVTTQIRPCIVFSDGCEEASSSTCRCSRTRKVVNLVISEAEAPIAKGKGAQRGVSSSTGANTRRSTADRRSRSPRASRSWDCETQAEIDRYWSKLTATAARKVRAAG